MNHGGTETVFVHLGGDRRDQIVGEHTEQANAALALLGLIAVDAVWLDQYQISLGEAVHGLIDLHIHLALQHEYHLVAAVHMEREVVIGIPFKQKMIGAESVLNFKEYHAHAAFSFRENFESGCAQECFFARWR